MKSTFASFTTRDGVSERQAPGDYVVLVHGLGRTRASFAWMERQLHLAGYHVLNLGYPSQRKNLSDIAALHLAPVIGRHCTDESKRIHFVTHSLGGIVLRQWLRSEDDRNGATPISSRLGRVVMLAPPNQGSDILDRLRGQPWVRAAFGPVSSELGTAPDSAVNRLGPVKIETGVIMGHRALLPFFKPWLGPESDGIVQVDRGAVEGMTDFIVLPADHTFIMRRPLVRDNVLAFLRSGRFLP